MPFWLRSRNQTDARGGHEPSAGSSTSQQPQITKPKPRKLKVTDGLKLNTCASCRSRRIKCRWESKEAETCLRCKKGNIICRPQGQATQTNDTTDDEQDEHGSLPIWHDVLESLPVELRQEILSLSLAHLRIDRTLPIVSSSVTGDSGVHMIARTALAACASVYNDAALTGEEMLMRIVAENDEQVTTPRAISELRNACFALVKLVPFECTLASFDATLAMEQMLSLTEDGTLPRRQVVRAAVESFRSQMSGKSTLDHQTLLDLGGARSVYLLKVDSQVAAIAGEAPFVTNQDLVDYFPHLVRLDKQTKLDSSLINFGSPECVDQLGVMLRPVAVRLFKLFRYLTWTLGGSAFDTQKVWSEVEIVLEAVEEAQAIVHNASMDGISPDTYHLEMLSILDSHRRDIILLDLLTHERILLVFKSDMSAVNKYWFDLSCQRLRAVFAAVVSLAERAVNLKSSLAAIRLADILEQSSLWRTTRSSIGDARQILDQLLVDEQGRAILADMLHLASRGKQRPGLYVSNVRDSVTPQGMASLGSSSPIIEATASVNVPSTPTSSGPETLITGFWSSPPTQADSLASSSTTSLRSMFMQLSHGKEPSFPEQSHLAPVLDNEQEMIQPTRLHAQARPVLNQQWNSSSGSFSSYGQPFPRVETRQHFPLPTPIGLPDALVEQEQEASLLREPVGRQPLNLQGSLLSAMLDDSFEEASHDAGSLS